MSSTEIPEDIASLTGPMIIGGLLNWALLGALSVQVYIYYMAFPDDRLANKCVVYALYMTDVAQTVIVTHDIFYIYATHYGNLEAVSSLHLVWLSVPVLTGIMSCAVQLCYTYRIRVLSSSKALWLGISGIAIMQGIAGVIAGVRASQVINIVDLVQKTSVATTVWLVGSAVCDVVIASCMTFILTRKDTGFGATHTLISKLVRMTVETGCLTAATATVDLVIFLVLPTKPYHECISLVLAKLYSNSLLAAYNSRIRLPDVRNGQSLSQTGFLSFRKTAKKTGQALSGGTSSNDNAGSMLGGIHIHEEVWTTNIQLGSQGTDGISKSIGLSEEV